MSEVHRKITGVRLGVAIQVFTTLLILVVGFLVIERNLRELIELREPISPFQLKTVLLEIRAEVLVVAFIAFISGVILTFRIRTEVKRAIGEVKRLTRGEIDPRLPSDLSQEFVPLGTAIRDLGEAFSRFVQQSITDAIIFVDEKQSIEALNPTAEVLLGYRSEEISGRPLSVLFPKDPINADLYRWVNMQEDSVHGGGQKTGLLLSQSGERIHVRLATFQVRQEGKRLRGIVAGVFDMQEWTRLREEFERARRFSTLGMLVSGLAHEIKNPLGAIHGLVQMLSDDVPKNHPRRRYYETILEEVKRLNKIMERLLDLGSPSQWHFHQVPLTEIMREVDVLMRPEAEQRRVEIRGEAAADPCHITGDSDRLKQAIINVLKNAIEATAQDGTVIWKLESNERWVTLSIRNPGGPLPEDVASSQPFLAPSGKPDGAGLGLAITTQILHHHGGHLRVSNPRDGGVLVRLIFPIHSQREKTSETAEFPRPSSI